MEPGDGNQEGCRQSSEALPMTIDPQYTVGFSWARQCGFQRSQELYNHLWLAASLGKSLRPPFQQAVNASANFACGSPGNGGGLYNSGITTLPPLSTRTTLPSPPVCNAANYSFNAMPDVILKAAFEPGFGRLYEIFGIFSRFRDRVYPCVEYQFEPESVRHRCLRDRRSTTTRRMAAGGSERTVHLLQATGFRSSRPLRERCRPIRHIGSARFDGQPRWHAGSATELSGPGYAGWHAPRIDVYLNGGEEYVRRRFQRIPSLGACRVRRAELIDSGCYTETAPQVPQRLWFRLLTLQRPDPEHSRRHVRVLDQTAQRPEGKTSVSAHNIPT